MACRRTTKVRSSAIWATLNRRNEAADSEMGLQNTVLVAKAMALAGLDVLRDKQIRAEIRAEFDRQVPVETRELVQSLT